MIANVKFCKTLLGMSLLGLLASLLLIQTTQLDVNLQQLLFNVHSGWVLGKQNMVWQLLFYKLPKLLLIILAVYLSYWLIRYPFFAKQQPTQRLPQTVVRHGLLLLALISIPTTVATLKALTHTPCPVQLNIFGGSHIYQHWWQDMLKQTADARCFPAAHASGGFALVMLGFLSTHKKQQLLGISFGLAIGWLMGLYKMAIGDHFFSHTLVSMWLALLISASLTLLANQLAQKMSKNR